MSSGEAERVRILILEDNPGDARLALLKLQHSGMDVEALIASNAAEFQERLRCATFDLILSDYQLPGWSGRDALHHVRSSDSHTPFIFVSGTLGEELAVECIKEGATDYVLKGSLERLPLAVRRALSDRKLQEKNAALLDANRSKDFFLATMSHELRTPLNAILGFVGTLLLKLPGPLTADQEKQLRIIQKSAKHLLSLINDLLDLAQIDAGKMPLTLEPITCREPLEEVATTLKPLAEAKGLTLELALPQKDMIVQADRRALTQIVINLVNNAIKFTERGGVRIEARHIDDHDGSLWDEISITDTGKGIRPEEQARLFQAFSRVGPQNGQRIEGIGLGLHLSQRLAELMGGCIRLESEYGLGTQFTLRLKNASTIHPPIIGNAV